ncbi:hypothetical protein ACJJIX_12575 [Microbulbifer sp. VAAC004]|uniref:hypothetical protein n=1 Tax=unclassified Microbulbifer TaxID=2619833 RepID=UPI00403A53F3
MDKEIIRLLEAGKADQVDSYVKAMLVTDNHLSCGVNDFLFVYAAIYSRIFSEEKVSLNFLNSALLLLRHLQSNYPNESRSLASQEMYLLVRAIKAGQGDKIDRDRAISRIFELFRSGTGAYTPESARQEAISVNGAMASGNGKSVIDSMRNLRVIKNLLGPIELLSGLGVHLPSVYSDWLKIKGDLP